MEWLQSYHGVLPTRSYESKQHPNESGYVENRDCRYLRAKSRNEEIMGSWMRRLSLRPAQLLHTKMHYRIALHWIDPALHWAITLWTLSSSPIRASIHLNRNRLECAKHFYVDDSPIEGPRGTIGRGKEGGSEGEREGRGTEVRDTQRERGREGGKEGGRGRIISRGLHFLYPSDYASAASHTWSGLDGRSLMPSTIVLLRWSSLSYRNAWRMGSIILKSAECAVLSFSKGSCGMQKNRNRSYWVTSEPPFCLKP